MGRRRIRCLKHCGFLNSEIYGYDINDNAKSIATKLNIISKDSYKDFKGGLVFVCTPPKCHIEYVKNSIKYNHVFCEASVIPEDRHHYKEILDLAKENNNIIFPSSTIRFKDSIEELRKVINSRSVGEVLSYNFRLAQNLRQWHPNQDIKDFYVSDPQTGGAREMVVFELSWLSWLFGEEINVLSGNKLKISEISEETNIDDFYCFLINHNADLPIYGNIMIDVFSHRPTRVLEITLTKGNILFDWLGNKLIVFNEKGEEIKCFKEEDQYIQDGYSSFSKEKMYIKEVQSFISHTKTGYKQRYNLETDYKILETLFKIEAASQ